MKFGVGTDCVLSNAEPTVHESLKELRSSGLHSLFQFPILK